MMRKITFEKATINHKEIIFSWLAQPHIQEFWDNTQGHKDDILNFMEGRKSSSSYCGGKYVYWIASCDGQPYAMLMTIQATHKDDIGELKLSHLSKTGHTYGIDYMIGNTKYFGKGYGPRTLLEFVDFLRNSFDKKADTFLIDPAADNHKAKHVYEKAGFKHIADFVMGGDCSGSGKPHHLLIKKLSPIVILEQISSESSTQPFDEFTIASTQISDIETINKLSYQKRRSYEEAQPTFWKWTGESGEQVQRDWFVELLKCENHICLTAKTSGGKVIGFVIGKIISAPEVYDPGGLTLMIDDFCVENDKWDVVGSALISGIKSAAKDSGVTQIVVVSGSHDGPKISFLKESGLSSASNWFVGDIV